MVNLPGVWAVANILARPGIARPYLTVNSISQIDWQKVHASGVRYLVFDKDNCITRPHEDQLAPALTHSWNECKRVFGSENILLVSNSAGTRSDPSGLAAENVSSKLGIPVLLHASKKPSKSCAKQVVDYFVAKSQLNQAGETLPHILVIGDRITTDMVLASRIAKLLGKHSGKRLSGLQFDSTEGIRTPLCASVLTTWLWASESLGTRFMRDAESRLLKNLVRAGIPPGGGWNTRHSFSPPSWLREMPQSIPPATPEPSPESLVLSAVTSRLPSWFTAPFKVFARIGRQIARVGPIERAMRSGREARNAIFAEIFNTVKHTRALSWSLLTNTTDPTWKSTWRTKRMTNVLDTKRNAPVRGLGGNRQSRLFSTSALCSSEIHTRHERPVKRRTLPSEIPAPASNDSNPEIQIQPHSGIRMRQWFMALAALIILPVGFYGGIKLNDAIAQWRQGDISNLGHAENMEDFAKPGERQREAEITASDSALQLNKRIQQLERDYFLLTRERENLEHKLSRLEDRDRI
ncbi:phosphatidylglycerophosphatase [Malassezia psittaci]|uniref:Phosphatidylglycerophosphatase n=1 Tax=Malassezia psittaci TaxID=1821823 RepID=A0AAF0FCL0_9BASI|nr:phosphatidylglycerophosphatase [Malassezia psittaci]